VVGVCRDSAVMATGWAELVAAGTKRPMASLVRDYGEGREPKTGGDAATFDGAAGPVAPEI